MIKRVEDKTGSRNSKSMHLGIVSFSETVVSSRLNWPGEYPLEGTRTDLVDLLDGGLMPFFQGRDRPWAHLDDGNPSPRENHQDRFREENRAPCPACEWGLRFWWVFVIRASTHTCRLTLWRFLWVICGFIKLIPLLSEFSAFRCQIGILFNELSNRLEFFRGNLVDHF